MASLPPETGQLADEPLARPQDLLSFKQIEKLNLEIASLQNKIERLEKYSPLFPLVGSLLTVVALVFGFYQFRTQQQREFAAQSQNQLRSDVDQILRFAHDENQTISMVSFLLDDMKGLIDSASAGSDKKLADALKGSERRVTEALVEQIVYDADFEDSPRNVVFASKIVTKWKDYQNYLKEDGQLVTLRRIVQNYVNAMRDFRKNNASYLQQVSYNEGTQRFNVGENRILWLRLNFLMTGFKQHLQFLGKGQEEFKRKSIEDFEDSLCIKQVAHYFLGDDFIEGRCDRK